MKTESIKNETWTEFFYYGKNYKKAIKEFEKFIKTYKPFNYHFLNEDTHMLFRAEFKRIPKIKIWKEFKQQSAWHGEESNFKSSWNIWKRIMTASADFTFISLRKKLNEKKFFNKTFHCMLLQSGFDIYDEKRFFEEAAFGRFHVMIMNDICDFTKTDHEWLLEWYYNKEWKKQKMEG